MERINCVISRPAFAPTTPRQLDLLILRNVGISHLARLSPGCPRAGIAGLGLTARRGPIHYLTILHLLSWKPDDCITSVNARIPDTFPRR